MFSAGFSIKTKKNFVGMCSVGDTYFGIDVELLFLFA